MMKSWDLVDVKREKRHFRKIYTKLHDSEEKELVLDTIGSLGEIIDYFRPKFSTKRKSFKDVSCWDREFSKHYEKYLYIIRDFVDSFEPVASNLDFDVKLTKINTEKNKIISVSYDFYKTIKGRFQKEVPKAFSARTRIKFEEVKDREKCDIMGLTFPVCYRDEIYMLLKTQGTINDYITSIHEFAHALVLKMNEDGFYDIEKYCFVELESIFFEMIGTDYLVNKMNIQEQGLSIAIDNFIEMVKDGIYIVNKLNLQGVFGKLKYRDLNKYVKYLEKVEMLDDESINEVLFHDLLEIFHYVFSYLTAIEFYLRYQVNKEDTLEKLAYFTSLADLSFDNYLKELKKMGIVPGQNVHVYVEQLKNKIKEIEDEKKLRY